jgi:hypothetical protein
MTLVDGSTTSPAERYDRQGGGWKWTTRCCSLMQKHKQCRKLCVYVLVCISTKECYCIMAVFASVLVMLIFVITLGLQQDLAGAE